ncbi:hypothetical protein AVEN_219602-1 [Araneus ventricosus]|uniref:Uncharacterized protein n=1 Tax=Araneus ventricosus TaxID=182803 RepID=A0A4Y2TBQ2_ARAVE|nr:hypothetical protein AVEN_219602-1 [Araneus ventricosus]
MAMVAQNCLLKAVEGVVWKLDCTSVAQNCFAVKVWVDAIRYHFITPYLVPSRLGDREHSIFVKQVLPELSKVEYVLQSLCNTVGMIEHNIISALKFGNT